MLTVSLLHSALCFKNLSSVAALRDDAQLLCMINNFEMFYCTRPNCRIINEHYSFSIKFLRCAPNVVFLQLIDTLMFLSTVWTLGKFCVFIKTPRTLFVLTVHPGNTGSSLVTQWPCLQAKEIIVWEFNAHQKK